MIATWKMLPRPAVDESSRPAATVLINALAMHSVSDAARVFLDNVIRGLPEAWPEAHVVVIVRHGAKLPSGARITAIRLGSSGSGVLRVVDELVRVRWIIRRVAPDVVINPNESIPGGVRAPLVVVAQNLFFHCPEIGPLRHGSGAARLRSRLQFAFYRWRMPHAYARADATVTVSAHAAGELAEHAELDLEKAHVVHYGADRLPIGARARPGTNKKILIVGAVAHYKRVEQALEALAILRQAGDYVLWLAGGCWPGQEDVLRSRARELGLQDAVRFLGPVGSDELVALFASSHVGLALSACESFGIPVIEGLRAGLPHVVADEPWSAETVADSVVRVDARDPSAIAMGIRRLEDPKEWEIMAQRGRERASRYTWQANAAGIAAVAIRVVEQRRMSTAG